MLIFLFFLVFPLGVTAGGGPLRVVCDEWPPYQIKKNNNVSGFSTKVVETIFERMKTTIEKIQVYPWKRAILMLEKGKADALFSANFKIARTGYAFYPEEAIINSPWVLWVREGEGFKFRSFDDLSGNKIGMVRGYSYTSDLWNFVKKHTIYDEVYSDELNFKKLKAGRVDFIPAELRNGLHIVKSLRFNKIIPIVENPIKNDGLYIIFNKNSVKKTFVDRFSDELKKLKQESLYKKLYYEYIDY